MKNKEFLMGMIAEDNASENLKKIVELWNKWAMRTMIMSVGNMNVEEWTELIDFSAEHLDDAMQFIEECYESEEIVKMWDWTLSAYADAVLSTNEYGKDFFDRVHNQPKLQYMSTSQMKILSHIAIQYVKDKGELDASAFEKIKNKIG